MLGVVPAQKRLERKELAGLQVDDRLIGEVQLLAFERTRELVGELAVADRPPTNDLARRVLASQRAEVRAATLDPPREVGQELGDPPRARTAGLIDAPLLNGPDCTASASFQDVRSAAVNRATVRPYPCAARGPPEHRRAPAPHQAVSRAPLDWRSGTPGSLDDHPWRLRSSLRSTRTG